MPLVQPISKPNAGISVTSKASPRKPFRRSSTGASEGSASGDPATWPSAPLPQQGGVKREQFLNSGSALMIAIGREQGLPLSSDATVHDLQAALLKLASQDMDGFYNVMNKLFNETRFATDPNDVVDEKLLLGAFSTKSRVIQRSDFLLPPFVKTAHPQGVSGIVTIGGERWLARIGPGGPGAAPGMAFLRPVVAENGQVSLESAVLISTTAKDYGSPLSSTAFGVTTTSDGSTSTFVPAPILSGATLTKNQAPRKGFLGGILDTLAGNRTSPTYQWRQVMTGLEPGTLMGQLNGKDVRVGTRLSSNRVSDHSLRIRRDLNPANSIVGQTMGRFILWVMSLRAA